jgi:hypothetical protein
MTKKIASFILLTTLFLQFVPFQSKTPFEGVIEFDRKAGSSQMKYKYFIKDDKIRIEDYGSDGTLQGIMLVNTTANKVIGLSPDRKLYMDVPNNRIPKDVAVEVKKTGNTKDIQGYKCSEIKVTCKDESRVITYWVGGDNFTFLLPMLKTMNRMDKTSVYFLKIPDVGNVFPMIGEEKKLDGTLLSLLKVTSIKEQTLDNSLFEIPKGYSKFEK